MSKSIGEILNSKRRELGFSQAELASALAIDGIEVTNQAISKWETGSTLPNARQFLALCRAQVRSFARPHYAGLTSSVVFQLPVRLPSWTPETTRKAPLVWAS